MAYVIDDAGKQGVFKDATLAYVSVKNPEKTKKPEDAKRYSVAVIAPEEDGKEHKKRFPKASVTMMSNADIRAQYKVEPPTDAPLHAVIKVRAKATINKDNPEKGLRAGDDVPYDWPSRPKVYLPEEREQEDGSKKKVAVDKTSELFVPNGSKGSVVFAIRSDAYGSTPDLRKVVVTDLKESNNTSSILGMEFDDAPSQPKPVARNESPRHEQVDSVERSSTPNSSSAAPKHAAGDDGFPDI